MHRQGDARKGDAAALRVLSRAVDAHRAARTFSASFRNAESMGDTTREMFKGRVSIARPGKARLELIFPPLPAGGGVPVPGGRPPGAPPGQRGGPRLDAFQEGTPQPTGERKLVIACNGSSLCYTIPLASRYWRVGVRPVDSSIFRTIDAPRLFDYTVPALLAGQTPYGADYREVRLDGEETIDGTVCDRIALICGSDAGDPTRVRLAFARKDGLLRRIRTARNEFPEGWSEVAFTEVRTNATFPPGTFVPRTTGLTEGPAETGYSSAIRLGAEAPLLLARDRKGREIDLDALRGSVVLVHFWGLFAPRSVWSLPYLAPVRRRFAGRKDFALIGVCLDPKGQAAQVERAIARHGITWPVIFDGLGWESGPAKVWKVEALPSTFVIGRDGRVFDTNPVGEDIAASVAAALAVRPTPKRGR